MHTERQPLNVAILGDRLNNYAQVSVQKSSIWDFPFFKTPIYSKINFHLPHIAQFSVQLHNKLCNNLGILKTPIFVYHPNIMQDTDLLQSWHEY